MEKPKRFVNSFLQFCVQERPKVQCQLKTTSPKMVTKELAKRWRCLQPKDKKKFEAMACKDKVRWLRQMEVFRRQRGNCGNALQAPLDPEGPEALENQAMALEARDASP